MNNAKNKTFGIVALLCISFGNVRAQSDWLPAHHRHARPELKGASVHESTRTELRVERMHHARSAYMNGRVASFEFSPAFLTPGTERVSKCVA